jgi:hypothetical protein
MEEQVENNGEEREIVTSRLDATMIHSQEKGERNIVVKLYLKGEAKLP